MYLNPELRVVMLGRYLKMAGWVTVGASAAATDRFLKELSSADLAAILHRRSWPIAVDSLQSVEIRGERPIDAYPDSPIIMIPGA